MDKKKILQLSTGAILGTALLTLFVLWVVAKFKEKRAYGDNQDSDKNNTMGSASTSGSGLPIFPLRWGSGGSNSKNVQVSQAYVRGVQVLCNNWIHAGLDVDGVWGRKTEAAVQRLKNARYYKKAGSAQVNTTDVFAQNIVSISGTSRVQIPTLASYNRMSKWNTNHVKQSFTFLI